MNRQDEADAGSGNGSRPLSAPARNEGWLGRNRTEYLIYAVVVLAAFALAVAAVANLRSRGIHAGFGFLWDTAGFDVGFSLIPYDATNSYARVFLVGLLNTLFVSFLALLLATGFGLALAIARLSDNRPLRAAATTITEFVRNTPLLLQLFAWYFMVFGALPAVRQSLDLAGIALLNNRGIAVAAPQLGPAGALVLAAAAILIVLAIVGRRLSAQAGHGWWKHGSAVLAAGGIVLGLAALLGAQWDLPRLSGFNVIGGVSLPPEFAALVTALAVYASVFVGEAFRSGFLSVAPSQWEAAHALGLGRFAALRLVIIPQAVRAALPALGNQFVNVVKASSLAAAIGFPDLMQVFGKTTLNQTGQAVEVIALTMAVYLTISLAISALVHRYGTIGKRSRT